MNYFGGFDIFMDIVLIVYVLSKDTLKKRSKNRKCLRRHTPPKKKNKKYKKSKITTKNKKQKRKQIKQKTKLNKTKQKNKIKKQNKRKQVWQSVF